MRRNNPRCDQREDFTRLRVDRHQRGVVDVAVGLACFGLEPLDAPLDNLLGKLLHVQIQRGADDQTSDGSTFLKKRVRRADP